MNFFSYRHSLISKAAAGLVLAGWITILLAAQGCSDAANSPVQTTGVPAGSTVATASATTSTVPAATTTGAAGASQDAGPQQPCPPQPQAVQPAIASYSVNKALANFGEMITFTAEIQGDPASVRVIFGASGGDISTTHNISVMLKQGTAGGVTTWTTSVAAPHGSKMPEIQGQCFYRIEVISTDNTYIKAMDDAHYFEVNG